MRPTCCGFRHRPRPSEKELPVSNCGLAESVRKFLRPRSLSAAVKAKQKQFSGPEQWEVYVHNGPTLGDLFTSSPAGFNRSSEGGDVPANKQSSRRIHPSLDGGIKAEVLPKSGEAKTVQVEMEKMALCRTKSGKEKKKVSFRSPEVADVFVVDYPPPPLPEICVIDKE